jgi:hypothetical protein
VRHELPKQAAETVGGWIRASAPNGCASPALASAVAGELGAAISAPANRYGVVPDLGALGRLEPHPAALAIGEAMLGLDAVTPASMDEWDAFEDLDGLAHDPIAAPLLEQAKRDARGQAGAFARMIGALSGLMVKRAVLGAPRGWDCGEVSARLITGANGKPLWFRKVTRPAAWNMRGEVTATCEVEVDGRNDKTQRPHDNAYRKHELTPDPLTVALARAEWQLWRAALDVIWEDAHDEALAHGVTLTPSRLPMRPWVEPMPCPRVLGGGEVVEQGMGRVPPRAGARLLQWQPRREKGA